MGLFFRLSITWTVTRSTFRKCFSPIDNTKLLPLNPVHPSTHLLWEREYRKSMSDWKWTDIQRQNGRIMNSFLNRRQPALKEIALVQISLILHCFTALKPSQIMLFVNCRVQLLQMSEWWRIHIALVIKTHFTHSHGLRKSITTAGFRFRIVTSACHSVYVMWYSVPASHDNRTNHRQ